MAIKQQSQESFEWIEIRRKSKRKKKIPMASSLVRHLEVQLSGHSRRRRIDEWQDSAATRVLSLSLYRQQQLLELKIINEKLVSIFPPPPNQNIQGRISVVFCFLRSRVIHFREITRIVFFFRYFVRVHLIGHSSHSIRTWMLDKFVGNFFQPIWPANTSVWLHHHFLVLGYT
jgi:hypothetical protein